MVVKGEQRTTEEKVKMSGKGVEKELEFKWLGILISADRGIGEEVIYRLHEGNNIWGTLESCERIQYLEK